MNTLLSFDKSVLYVVILGLVTAVVWFLYHQGTRSQRLDRILPTSKLGSLTVGMVKTRGTTRDGSELCRTPYSDTECIAYLYRKKRVRIEDGRVKVRVIDQETDARPFILFDDTGAVTVELGGLEMDGIPSNHHSIEESDIMHEEVILSAGIDVMMITRATPRGGQMALSRDPESGVHTLTERTVALENEKLAPMMRLLGNYTVVTLLVVAFLVSY